MTSVLKFQWTSASHYFIIARRTLPQLIVSRRKTTLRKKLWTLETLDSDSIIQNWIFQKFTKVSRELTKGIASFVLFKFVFVFPQKQFIFLDQTSSECNHCLKQSQKWCFSNTHVDHVLKGLVKVVADPAQIKR